jgi:chromosome partitioning protein
MNQKGGVGKTTTTVNLGAALARAGKRVLFIDLDPQAHLTLHLGVDPEALERSVYHVLTDPAVTAESVAQSAGENMAVLPGEVNLAGVESELAALAASGHAQRVLREKCAAMIQGGTGSGGKTASGKGAAARAYDFVLIDCPPSLGLLTLNALALADEVFVPMQAHFLALQGLSKLLETVALVKQSVNPALHVTGIILCMYEGQTVLAGEVLADLGSFLEAARGMEVPWRDAVVLKPPIRRNIKLAECPSFGKSIFDYAGASAGAGDYKALAEAVTAMAVRS